MAWTWQGRLLQKLRARGAFVFAAFGSSVSAGHDNFANQSWPFELERLLKPTFRNLGFDFELRQRSFGGYGEMPFAAGCLASRAGAGVDALSWEFAMFRDPPCECHHFLAEAAAMTSSPMVFVFEGGKVNFDGLDSCDRWRWEAGVRVRRWPTSTGKRDCYQVREAVRKAGLRNNDDTFSGQLRQWRPNQWYLTEEFVSRTEAEWVARNYATEAESVAKNYSDCGIPKWPPTFNTTWFQKTGVAPQWERAGRALYTVVVGAAARHVLPFPMYRAREKAFNVNVPHRGPLGHTLIASSIAHFMLTNLQSALAHERRTGEGPSDDNPLVGKPVIGQLGEPRCGSLRPKQCRTGVLPTTEGTILSSARDPSSQDTWLFETSWNQWGAHGAQVDVRMVYRGTKASGELKLSFEADGDGQYVLLCGAPCGWFCRGNAGYVSSKSQKWWRGNQELTPERRNVSDLTLSIDGLAVSSEELNRLHDEIFSSDTGKFCPGCRPTGDVCQPVAKVAKGRHTVGARVEARSREEVAPAGVPLPKGMHAGDEMYVEIQQVMVVG